jgi:hypothetical protein
MDWAPELNTTCTVMQARTHASQTGTQALALVPEAFTLSVMDSWTAEDGGQVRLASCGVRKESHHTLLSSCSITVQGG